MCPPPAATGTRNFTCGADGKIALSQAIANVTGDYSGLIYYKPDGTPTADYYDKATGKYVGSIDLVLPPTQVPAPNNAAVPLARWAVKSTTGNVPVVSYLTRTETVGGKQPDRCEPAGALLTVPYTSALTYYKKLNVLPRRPFQHPSLTCVKAVSTQQITGVVFEPFQEVQHELAVVDKTDSVESYARVDFHPNCEAAINEQINIEYNVSYIYHALYSYFDRDNVGLPGLAAWFKAESLEERHHAELLMDYQNLRGGKVKLQSIMMPEMEFNHPEKGDALYAMELVLSLEKLNFQKLRHLHEVAEQHGDSQMCDFVEGQLLADQVKSVKEVAEYVSQLRRVGKGLGVFEFDKSLQAAA
ncbi:hypothetical protein N2152v2_003026 [Parachlorella kessleri]